MEEPEKIEQPTEGEGTKPSKPAPRTKRKTRANGNTNQVKPSKRLRKSKNKATRSMGSIDTAIYKRICSVLSKRWQNVNAKEISLICGVALCLQVLGKRTIAKDDLFRWLGYRVPIVIRKQSRWLETASDKGLLIRIQFDNIGHGYGLTEYGQAFINDLDREFDKARQWVEDQRRFTDIVIYLDRVKEQLHPRQRALFTPAQIEQLKAIGKEP